MEQFAVRCRHVLGNLPDMSSGPGTGADRNHGTTLDPDTPACLLVRPLADLQTCNMVGPLDLGRFGSSPRIRRRWRSKWDSDDRLDVLPNSANLATFPQVRPSLISSCRMRYIEIKPDEPYLLGHLKLPKGKKVSHLMLACHADCGVIRRTRGLRAQRPG
ncbi:hypothetical protein LY78DRAFT_248971 [Colletotrichum sublineola]|nr:hypothetical protein LY78DRAFT_248971 [Colletotrichum sublineola]